MRRVGENVQLRIASHCADGLVQSVCVFNGHHAIVGCIHDERRWRIAGHLHIGLHCFVQSLLFGWRQRWFVRNDGAARGVGGDGRVADDHEVGVLALVRVHGRQARGEMATRRQPAHTHGVRIHAEFRGTIANLPHGLGGIFKRRAWAESRARKAVHEHERVETQ